jgi:hypothetical protein
MPPVARTTGGMSASGLMKFTSRKETGKKP